MAHVLFMDLVAYSQSNTDRQSTLVSELHEVVRSVPEFQAARNANRVIPLDSGDGMMLVFLEDPTAPVRCAIGISQAIRSHPDLRLRMGINTGPVHIRSGISTRRNAFGKAINYAQRAMDRGDAGHILITAETVSILQDLEGWRDYLHDIGEYEVKHGVMLHLYNCYTDTAGNSATPAKPQGEKPAAQSPTAAAQKPNLIGAILHTYASPVSSPVPVTPPALDRLIRRSLAKDPNDRRHSDRRQSARDLAGELQRIVEAGSQAAAPAAAVGHRRSRQRLAGVVAAGLALVAIGRLAVPVRHVRELPPPQQVVHFRLDMPKDFVPLTINEQPHLLFSPDGSRVVVAGRSAGQTRQLWMRSLDSTALRPVPGAEESRSAVFSPDSRSLAVVTGANLQRLDLATGAIQPLTELRGFVTSWSREGVILAVEDYVIKQLAASGGTPKPVTELDHSRGEFVHTFARFLPDGRHFLFHARTTSSNPSDWAVYVGAINDLKFRKLLLQGTGPATYAPPGWLLFTLDDALLAQPFDAHTLQFTGERALVADHVDTNAYAVSETGSLVWRAGSSRKVAQLTWFDRTGKILEKIGEPGEIANPVLSPDGKRVLITIRDPVARTRDIWIMNLERGTKSRLTFDAAEDYNPVWSSDGAYVVFSSSRKGKHDIYRKRADGVGGEEELLASDLDKSVDSLSPDGKFVLYNVIEAGKPISIWELPLGADHKPVPIVAGPANYSQFSPNGRWIAYTQESVPRQVFVQSAPGSVRPAGKWQVSIAGGFMPQWRRDGKELFFIGRNDELMAAPVESEGTSFEYGTAMALFPIRPGVSLRNHFTASADGQRFLFAWAKETDDAGQTYVVLNWPAFLKKP